MDATLPPKYSEARCGAGEEPPAQAAPDDATRGVGSMALVLVAVVSGAGLVRLAIVGMRQW